MTRPDGEGNGAGEAPEEMRTSITTTTMKKGNYIEKPQEEETDTSETSEESEE